MFLRLPVISLALTVAACSAPYTPVDPANPADVARIAPKLEGRNRVTLVSGAKLELQDAEVAADSIRGTVPRSDERASFPTLQVVKLSHHRRAQGAARGLWLGALAGTLVGALATATSDYDGFVDPGAIALFGGGAAGGVLGFGIGSALGTWKDIPLRGTDPGADPGEAAPDP
jgi:hypothetical protein